MHGTGRDHGGKRNQIRAEHFEQNRDPDREQQFGRDRRYLHGGFRGIASTKRQQSSPETSDNLKIRVNIMQKAYRRKALRLEVTIMQELSRILIEEVEDPRLELVTISGTRLNKDLSIAEILYTHRSGQEKKLEVETALESARGFIRTQLGKKLKTRYVPQLRFKWDSFLEETIYDSPKTDSRDNSKL